MTEDDFKCSDNVYWRDRWPDTVRQYCCPNLKVEKVLLALIQSFFNEGFKMPQSASAISHQEVVCPLHLSASGESEHLCEVGQNDLGVA